MTDTWKAIGPPYDDELAAREQLMAAIEAVESET